jgi:hypothetical protein
MILRLHFDTSGLRVNKSVFSGSLTTQEAQPFFEKMIRFDSFSILIRNECVVHLPLVSSGANGI